MTGKIWLQKMLEKYAKEKTSQNNVIENIRDNAEAALALVRKGIRRYVWAEKDALLLLSEIYKIQGDEGKSKAFYMEAKEIEKKCMASQPVVLDMV